MVVSRGISFYVEKERKTPIVNEYDVIVVGGSQSGCAAAICAARQGASVLIVERNCFLGGQSVGTMVVQWEKRAFINNLGAIATRGIAKEMLDRILEKGGSDKLWEDPPGCEEMRDGEEWLDVEAIKQTLLEMCLEARVEILFDTLCVDAMLEEEGNYGKLPSVNGITVENKSGRQAIKAKVVVDASAYLDVVWFAAGEKGVTTQPPEKRIKSGWYTWLGGVDTERYVKYLLESKPEIRVAYPSLDNAEKVLHHLRTGRLLLYRGARLTQIIDKARELGYFDDWPDHLRPPETLGGKWLGGDRWSVEPFGRSTEREDTLDAWSLSRAEIGRQILESRLLRVYRLIPGWQKAYISRTAVRIGLRETRILKAVTMITTKDIFEPEHDRSDAIGRSGGHDPGKNKLFEAYPIPYGALIPKELDGVICCSRSIGAEPGVPLNAHRGIVPTIVVGQAAGTAAGLAALKNIEPRHVDIQKLREILRRDNVVLDVETMKLDTIPKGYHDQRNIHWSERKRWL